MPPPYEFLGKSSGSPALDGTHCGTNKVFSLIILSNNQTTLLTFSFLSSGVCLESVHQK